MNKLKKYWMLSIQLCFIVSSLTAQDKYRAVHWGLNDGLSDAFVYHMRQDVNGFLWFGTQSELSRFDGSVFKNYYHDPKKSGTIDAKFTADGLVEDSLHNIWIGTENGLYRYDIKADTFARFLSSAPFCATSKEILCFEYPAIVSFNIHNFTKKTVATLTPADSVGGRLSIFSAFFDERTNSLWMLRSISDNSGWHSSGLMQLSLTTGGRKYYNWTCYKNIPGHNHHAEGMCYDHKRNCLWINSTEGLMQFTLDDYQFHFMGEKNDFFNAKDYDRWVGICMDLQDRVWLATQPKGIVIYDPSDQSVTLPFKDGSAVQKDISEKNGILYLDRNGIIWSGFWLGKGIYQIIPFSPSITHYKTSSIAYNIPVIANFQNAGQGKMWIGSTDQIHRIFDTHSGNIHTLSENDLPPDLRKTAFVPSLIDTIAKKAYLYCFAKGLWVLDMNTNKCQPFIFKNSANHEVMVTHELGSSQLKDGGLICGIQDKRQSVFLLNGKNMVVHELFSFPYVPGNVFVLGMADDRFVFFRRSDRTGKLNLTYTYRNNKWLQSSHPFDSIPWSHIIYNKKDQGYWVVVEKELIHYSKDFRIVRVYTPQDGLPEFDIQSLIADAKGNIWFSTDRSIHQLNTETEIFSTLSEKDGFRPQDFGGVELCMGTDGNLYLGGFEYMGFVRISPDKYTSTSSSVYLKSLEINQKPFPLSTGVNNLQELSLRHFQNNITIETGIIDYFAKGKGNIRYKLEAEGKNADWQYSPAYYTIRYENLSSGKYRLFIQASNAANEFKGPVKILKIQISRPWWQTWWAYGIYLIILIFIVWRIHLYQKGRTIKMEREKIRDRELEQAKEIENANILLELQKEELQSTLEHLKLTQAELIQSEKMASLGQLIAGIAHEINTPLGAINASINTITDSSQQSIKLLPALVKVLSEDELKLFMVLVNKSALNNNTLSSKEEREVRRKITTHLEEIKITGADDFADILVDIGIYDEIDNYLSLFKPQTMQAAYHLSMQIKNSQNIKMAVDRASKVVFALKNYARYGNENSMVEANIVDGLETVLTLYQNQMKHGITLHKEFEEVPPILCYPDELNQVWTNLIHNAIQAMEGKGELSIHVETYGRTSLRVSITDTGKGIPPEIKDRIFDAFFTTKPAGEGAGLGLYIVKQIIDKHKGTITFESEVGKGTSFIVTFPNND